MREFLLQLREKVLGWWTNSTPNQKLLAGGGGLALLLALIIGVWIMGRGSEKVPLYTQLQPSDAAAIVAKLKEKKIPYQLSEDGTTILVDPQQKYQVRLDLIAEGLPRGVAGFESLSETRFGETARDKELRYLLALQGELSRTIKCVEGVEESWVYITAPREALFTKDQEPRTASVMLKLKPGALLEAEQVKGIVFLVARSVEGLKPENVTVVDVNGKVLSEDLPGIDSAFKTSQLSAKQLAVQQQFEKELARSVQSMLEQVVGYGKAVVRVRAELDFDQQEIVDVQWGNKVPRSTETTEEVTSGQGTAAAEAVGTPSNIPGGTAYPGGGQVSTFNQEKTSSIVNNEIDRRESHRIVAPGAIKRLSVAVIVDGEQGDAQKQAAIRQAVAHAAGINFERGDQIDVSVLPFNTAYWDAMQAEMAKEARRVQLQQWALVGGTVLALLLTGVIVYLFMRRRRVPVLDTAVGEPIPVEELLAVEEMVSPEEKEMRKLREHIEKLAKERPEEVAQLVRTWLMEDLR